MARITVQPQEFHLVHYDAAEILRLAEEVADRIGFPADTAITIDIDETTPLQRVTVRSVDPVVVHVEGGAFEDVKAPRRLSPAGTAAALARVLYRVHDRVHGGFADAPADADLDFDALTAWDAYAMGRAERAGFHGQRQRWLYAFRNRHGFNDAADAVFDRLWSADTLTWPELVDRCAATRAARTS